MQTVELSQNKVALLDDQDHAMLSSFNWFYRGERHGGPGYAIRHEKVGKKYRTVYMHRQVMSPVPPECEVVFLNGDRLDCRRQNLRVVSKQEARRLHKRARSDSQSGIKGVSYNRRARTWSVDIFRNGRATRIGTFLTQEHAMDAYQEALQKENPDLHTVPDVIERRVEPQQENAEEGRAVETA
jgi:hypothetical protein